MSGSFQIEHPEDIEATLTLTLKMGEWRQIQEQLEDSWRWPMSELADTINSLVKQATEKFYPKEEAE